MKIRNGLLLAGLAIATLPSFSQQKEKEKDGKVKRIEIISTDDKNEKMNIVVDGDKVTVNGKDISDLGSNVHVNVMTLDGPRTVLGYGPSARTMTWNDLSKTAFLGVETSTADNGARIDGVTKNSAAEKSGLKEGDILTKIGDVTVKNADEVTKAVRSHKPGDKVAIAYTRDGKAMTTNAELGKHSMDFTFAVPPTPAIPAMPNIERLMDRNYYGQGDVIVRGFRNRPKLGMSVQELEEGPGVKVLDVEKDGNADKAGFKKDDVIVGVDDHEVTDANSLTSRLTNDKTSYTFRVKRGNKTENLTLKIPKKVKTVDL